MTTCSETKAAPQSTDIPVPEKLLTIADAAKALGVHVWALRRAVKAGTIPSYAPFNCRKLLRLSEVVAAIEATKAGGGDD